MIVYLIQITTFSSDLYSESEIHTSDVFTSREDAETYILEKNLLERGECYIMQSQLKGKICLNL